MENKLLLLQKAIKPIAKDSENPFYKSKYFDINTLIADIKPILNELGIIIMQPLSNKDGRTTLKTIMINGETGQTIIESETLLPENPDPQKMGSITTYFRRYSLQSLLLLEALDDDANLASNSPVASFKTASSTSIPNEPVYEQQEDDKQWITDSLFDEAIKKSVEAGAVKFGTPAAQVMTLLRRKYKVAKKYEQMIDSTINKYALK